MLLSYGNENLEALCEHYGTPKLIDSEELPPIIDSSGARDEKIAYGPQL